MGSTLTAAFLVIAILALSAVITQVFARAMYLTCPECRTLNARRRTLCRNCRHDLRKPAPPGPQS